MRRSGRLGAGRWTIVALALVAAALSPDVARAEGPGTLAGTLVDRGAVAFWSPAGEPLGQAATGAGPRGMARNGSQLFVANLGEGKSAGSSISVIDLRERKPLRTTPICVKCAPRALAFDEFGVLYVVGQADLAVYRLPPPYQEAEGSAVVAWGFPTGIVNVPGTPCLAVSFKGAAVGAFVRRIPLGAGRIELGPMAEAVAARPGTHEAWYALNPASELVVVTPPQDAGEPTLRRMAGPKLPAAIAFTPDGARALVTGTADRALVAIDAASGKEVGRLALDGVPREVVVSPDGTRAAVYLPERAKIVVASLGPGAPQRVTSFDTGGALGGLAWLP